MKISSFKAFLYALAILLISILSFNAAFATVTLTDIEGHKNQTAIEYLVEKNIVDGNPDGTYRPDTGINRAETLKLLFESKGGAGLVEPTEDCFPDVEVGQWYTVYVCSAKNLGYVEGYPDGNFRPGDYVNRVEFLKLLAMFAEWDLSEGEGEPLFDDTPAGTWYEDYVKYAKKKNLIEYEGTTYGPGEPNPRGEVAETIFRNALIKALDKDVYDEADVPEFLGTPVVDTTALSQDAALNILETGLLYSHTYGDDAFVYSPSSTLKEGDYVSYYDVDGEGQYADINEESWFFWVDYHPTEMMFHETALATVNMDGDLTVYESTAYPFINGVAKYDVDTQRIPSADLKLDGQMSDEEIAELIAELSQDDPQFGACNADVNENKRAIVAYFGEDVMIKRNAVNIYEHLCEKNYITTVVTGDTAEQGYNNIATALLAVEDESHNTGFSSVAFHVTSHGVPGTGDLHVADDLIIAQNIADEAVAVPVPDAIDLDSLAALWGANGFEIGTGGIWTDSFHIIHETCFSGNAVAKYQAEAYIAGSRETAVGWVAASSQADKTSRITPLAKYGAYFTQALMQCQTNMTPYATFADCVAGKVNKLAGMDFPFQEQQVPILEKLSPLTDDYVPFLP